MEAMEFRKSAIELRSMWVIGNEYLQKARALDEDQDGSGLPPAYRSAMPSISPSLSRRWLSHSFRKHRPRSRRALCGATIHSLAWPTAVTDTLQPGAPISVPDVLFAKIEETQLAEWTERFGGPDK